MFRSACRHAVLSALALLVVVTAAAAQDTASLIDQGVEAYRRGDNAAAIEAFKAALANDPGSEDAWRLYQDAEQQVLLQMLMEKGELGQLAERFLGLARVGKRVVASDPGNARQVVTRLFGDDPVDREKALLELQGTYGEWAVPALVGPLGDRSDIDRRVAAIQALIRLGDQAVVPLVQVLHTDDELTRTNAAAVLGSLKDGRAAAALAWHAKSDDSELVRNAAAAALDKLAPALASIELATRDPMTLTLGLAERWLIGDPALLKPYDSAQVKWTWSDGALHGEPILGGLYGLWLASATLEDGLAAGATDPARSFLAAVHAAMVAEIEGAADLDLDGDLLASAQAMLPGLKVQLALAGPDRGAGLSLLLDSNQTAAAKALIASMDRSPREVTALRSALGEDEFGVSLAAALALGRQGVTAPNVVAHLGHALTTIPDRLVMAIGDTGLTGQAGGWELLTSDQVAGGLARAKAFPPKDVIVVQDGLQDVTLDALVFGLLDDPRTADVPLIIATDDVDGVSSLYGDKVAAVVARASWDDVRSAAGDPGAVQRAAMDNALAASRVLARMPAAAVRAAGGPITQALTSAASDDVKAAVVHLAGMAGVTDATPAVTALVMGGGSRELQLASLTAAAHLWALAGGLAQADDALVSHLHELVGGDDADLALAAAAALGQLQGAGAAGMVSEAG